VRVGDLQTLDGADILGTLDLQGEPGKISCFVDRAHGASVIRNRDGDQGERQAAVQPMTPRDQSVLPSSESCSHTRVAQHNAGDPHPEGRKQ
jgi:hypothetical protein